MKAITALVVLITFAGGAQAQSIDRYVETLTVEPDGSGHVVTVVQLSAGPGTVLRLPVAIGQPHSVSVTDGFHATAKLETADGHTWVTVDVPDDRAEPTGLQLTYDVEGVVNYSQAPLAHGDRRLRYEFVNTTGVAIAEFESTLVLPAGVVTSSIDGVTPAPTETTVGRPFAIEERDGRPAIAIHAASLGVGDRAGVTVGFRPQSSSAPLLVVLAVVSAAYLYRFRDLARRRPGPSDVTAGPA